MKNIIKHLVNVTKLKILKKEKKINIGADNTTNQIKEQLKLQFESTNKKLIAVILVNIKEEKNKLKQIKIIYYFIKNINFLLKLDYNEDIIYINEQNNDDGNNYIPVYLKSKIINYTGNNIMQNIIILTENNTISENVILLTIGVVSIVLISYIYIKKEQEYVVDNNVENGDID